MNEKQICPFSLAASIAYVKEYANQKWSGRNRDVNKTHGCIKSLCALYNEIEDECHIATISKLMGASEWKVGANEF